MISLEETESTFSVSRDDGPITAPENSERSVRAVPSILAGSMAASSAMCLSARSVGSTAMAGVAAGEASRAFCRSSRVAYRSSNSARSISVAMGIPAASTRSALIVPNTWRSPFSSMRMSGSPLRDTTRLDVTWMPSERVIDCQARPSPPRRYVPSPAGAMLPPTVSFSGVSAVPMPTPPAARNRTWLGAVDVKSSSALSAQTNVPSWLALARRPAAWLYSPTASFWEPPGTVAMNPLAVLANPPPTAAPAPLAVLKYPPGIAV